MKRLIAFVGCLTLTISGFSADIQRGENFVNGQRLVVDNAMSVTAGYVPPPA